MPSLVNEQYLDNYWLEYIKDGRKIYEARVRKNYWSDVRKGDKIIFYNEIQILTIEVKNVFYYHDFIDSFRVFKQQLLPEVYSIWDVMRIYTDRDVDKYGVVIVEFVI